LIEDQNWFFKIVGDGPAREKLNLLVNSHGLQDKIQFLGWKSREEIRNLLRGSSLFVFPSRDEGMSNALLEAMSAGLAVIVSNIQANQDLIQTGVNGILVPYPTAYSWADEVKKVLADPILTSTLGKNAREHVKKYYSWEKTAKEYKDLTLEIIQLKDY
jgi:glycosyltransferase involved in cell wall biosynthesis